MKAIACILFAAFVAVTACSKKSQDDATPRTTTASEAPANTAPVVVASAAAPAPDDSDIDLPEDFADDAVESVKAENLEAQVSALEKEIATSN